MACSQFNDISSYSLTDAEKVLLIKLKNDDKEVKHYIKMNLSSFKKDIRKLIRKLRTNSSAERPINVSEENGDPTYILRASKTVDLLFSAEDISSKCSWEEVPYIALEIERITKHNNFDCAMQFNGRARKEENNTAGVDKGNINKIILEKLSRIEAAVSETPAKIQEIQMQCNSHKCKNSLQKKNNPMADVVYCPSTPVGKSVHQNPKKSPHSTAGGNAPATCQLPASKIVVTSQKQPQQIPNKPNQKTLAQTHHALDKSINDLSQVKTTKLEGEIPSKSASLVMPKMKEESSPIALQHFAQIIDSVVSGMDDYSAARYGSSDFNIEPPQRKGTEVTVHDFADFKQALENAESPFVETPKKSKKRKQQSIEMCCDIDDANVTINSVEKPKKKKHRISINDV